jgi:uncharacterized protein YceK
MMAGRTLSVVGLSVFAVLGGGCGTLNNLPRPEPVTFLGPGSPGSRTYGGVRAEWDAITGPHYDPKYPLILSMCLVPMVALDLPLTLVGDTITLPYTLAYDYGLFGRMCTLGPHGAGRERDEDPKPASTGGEPSSPWPKDPSR